MQHRSPRWMSSTSDIYVEVWEYSGKTRSPITRSLTEPVSHLCIPYSVNAAYDGLATYMKDDSIPKDVLYGGHGYRKKCRPQLWYKDVCKHECPKMEYTNWESLAENRAAWKQEPSSSLKKILPPKKSPGRGGGGRRIMLSDPLTCFRTIMMILATPLTESD